MLTVINKYLVPKHSQQAQWFAKKTVQVIYDDLRSHPSKVKSIRAFYNHEVQNCILKFEFNIKFIVDTGNNFLYVLLNYQTQEMEHYGRNFENHISDKAGSISWMRNNKVLAFYPDHETMSLLSTKING